MKRFLTLITAILFLFISCENPVTNLFEDEIKDDNSTALLSDDNAKKAYIQFTIVEPSGRTLKRSLPTRSIIAQVSPSSFTNVTFSGSKTDGSVSVTPVTAANLTALASQRIYVETGFWNFTLEAFLGSAKYIARLSNQEIVTGSNSLTMYLTPDTSYNSNPANHVTNSGSWKLKLNFKSDYTDKIKVSLFNYSDFAVDGTDPATLSPAVTPLEFLKASSDYGTTGAQSITSSEETIPAGDYIIYVSSYSLSNPSSPKELSTWSEFMRINPGVLSEATINLPDINDPSVYDVWIANNGHDDTGNGSKKHPYKTITRAYQDFTDKTALNTDGSYKNTIHILTDYTDMNSITSPQGTSGAQHVNIVGAKGGTDGVKVTLTVNVAKNMSFIFLESGQSLKVSCVDINSTRDLNNINDYCGYGCFFVDGGSMLTLEHCSIKNYYAKSCILNLVGICHLDDVEITDNFAVSEDPSDIWGCAVNVAEGKLYIKGCIKIKDNKTLNTSKVDVHRPYNVWIGKYDGITPSDHPIFIEGAITGSEIGVKTRSGGLSAFTSGYTLHGNSAPPSDYFTSDEGRAISLNASGEAELEAFPAGMDIPLTLEAVSGAATVTFQNKATGPVTYKVDGGADVEIASGATGTISLTAAGSKVEFFGDNDVYGTSNSSSSSNITCTADCFIYGNIMSLIDSTGYATATTLTEDYTFARLFESNTHIKNKNTIDLILPATELADNCYNGMFADCTNLLQAPELPATQLASNCYNGMFAGCANLDTAPELPAILLAEDCYRSMFLNCTGLRNAPDLPATTLASGSYWYMFKGCSSLTKAPELPAKILNTYCYTNMFEGCSNLIKAPELPAATLTQSCYSRMFKGCSSLNYVTCLATDISAYECTKDWLAGVAATGTFIKAPEMTGWTENSASGIPSGWTAKDKPLPLTLEAVSGPATVTFRNKAAGPVTYKVDGGVAVEIASGTTGTIELTVAGSKVEFFGDNELYAEFDYTTTSTGTSGDCSRISCSADCYVYGNIMSLIKSTDFENETVLTKERTFEGLFRNNSKITNKSGIPLLLPATTLKKRCYTNMFNGCINLTESPALPATSMREYCYESMFSGCTGLTSTPVLPATTLANSCYSYMFSGCTSLTNPPDLPATQLSYYCYRRMFSGCTSLTNAPVLPATEFTDYWSYCYMGMFYNCTSLLNAPELPATTLAEDCYEYMFYGCTSLTKAPILPANNLKDYCYSYMFSGCTNLNSVTCLATDISATNCTTDWLSGVAATGTFIKAPAMTDWTLNSASGIPAGWTVQDKPIPLTLEAVSGAATVSFQNKASGPVTYKVNGGSAVEIASGTTGTIELAAAGDKVEFFGDNAGYGDSTSSSSSNISCTADCYVYGNIMSLINSSSYEDLTEFTQTYTFAYLFYNNSKIKNKTGANLLLPATTLADDCYYCMFQGCTGLTAVPELPATTLKSECYYQMFYGCTGLTAAPELPATTLKAHCYRGMFQGCTGLTAAPELPATTVVSSCYYRMFQGCTGLTAAPELPATTLIGHCYYEMFNGCTGLTAAPELPATTLANYCYYQMFCGCTGLTAAPALPATTLADNCYSYMFYGCTNLHSVTCLATNISASDCVTDWLYGVASTGIFYKAAGIGVETSDGWTRDSSGIPSTWTVDSYLGNKVPGASLEPGDIVFNDGSAVAYSDTLTLTPEQAAAAIAVIFYKGDGLNKSGDTSIRTLGVGLIQKVSLAWAKAASGSQPAAAAIGQDITAIQGNLTSGDKYGKDNLSAISAFLTAAADLTDDTSDLNNYPVFKFAANYKDEKMGSETSSRLTGTAFENEWYIPSIQELYQAYLIKDTLNAALDLCGGAQMTSSYWSSNQNSGYKSNANNLTFANGNMTANGTGMTNGYQMGTRVIREF